MGERAFVAVVGFEGDGRGEADDERPSGSTGSREWLKFGGYCRNRNPAQKTTSPMRAPPPLRDSTGPNLATRNARGENVTLGVLLRTSAKPHNLRCHRVGLASPPRCDVQGRHHSMGSIRTSPIGSPTCRASHTTSPPRDSL